MLENSLEALDGIKKEVQRKEEKDSAYRYRIALDALKFIKNLAKEQPIKDYLKKGNRLPINWDDVWEKYNIFIEGSLFGPIIKRTYSHTNCLFDNQIINEKYLKWLYENDKPMPFGSKENVFSNIKNNLNKQLYDKLYDLKSKPYHHKTLVEYLNKHPETIDFFPNSLLKEELIYLLKCYSQKNS